MCWTFHPGNDRTPSRPIPEPPSGGPVAAGPESNYLSTTHPGLKVRCGALTKKRVQRGPRNFRHNPISDSTPTERQAGVSRKVEV